MQLYHNQWYEKCMLRLLKYHLMLELNSLKILIIVIITVIVDLKILLGLNILKISYANSIMFVKDMQIKIFIDGEEIRCGNEKDSSKGFFQKRYLYNLSKLLVFFFTKKLINIRMAITVALANAIKIQNGMLCPKSSQSSLSEHKPNGLNIQGAMVSRGKKSGN